MRSSLLLCLLASSAAAQIPTESRQLVVVTTGDWDATSGTLQRYERAAAEAAWRPVGEAVPVVVGRSGLGWGRGLHLSDVGRAEEPNKREGDGRAPAGVFALTEAFGYAPADSVATGLPYVAADGAVECVDDSGSAYYNRVVRRDTVAVDWTSHEEMRRRDALYRRGVVVAHNSGPAVPGGGSCIFLHQWSGPRSTTSGCSAMAAPALDALVGWLRADAAPILVQLPEAVHRRLRRSWGLP